MRTSKRMVTVASAGSLLAVVTAAPGTATSTPGPTASRSSVQISTSSTDNTASTLTTNTFTTNAATTSLVPTTGALWGAYVQIPGLQHRQAVLQREKTLGYKLRIDQRFRAWTGTTLDDEAWTISQGRIPMISWAAGPDVTALQITSGTQDGTIRKMAASVKALKAPVLLRFAYEMDQPPGEPRYIGTPTNFIAAWRRVHGIFASAGVTNVSWVWCGVAERFRSTSTIHSQDFYPGDAYVDWIGADVYNMYPDTPNWAGYYPLPGTTRPGKMDAPAAFAASRHKPALVGETATMEDANVPGRKAAWINDAHSWIKAHPNVKAVAYFDSISPRGRDFRVTTSASAFSAFKSWGADPYFKR